MPEPNKTSFEYKHLTEFTGGVRRDMRSDTIPDNAAVSAHNVSIRQGVVAADKGYTRFMGNVRGTPQRIENIQYPNGTTDMVLFTTDTVYERLSGQWSYAIDAGDGTGTVNYSTLSADAAASQAEIQIPEADVGKFSASVGSNYVGVRYKTQTAKTLTSTTKNTPSGNTTYKLPATDGQVFNVGDEVYVSGNSVADYNVLQTITAVTTVTTETTIVTSLDSTSFGSPSGTTSMEKVFTSAEFQTTISSIAVSGNPRTITLAENLPGRAIKGARLVRAHELDGLTTQACDAVIVPGFTPQISSSGPVNATKAGAIVYTNGIDIPKVLCAGAGGVTVRDLYKTNIHDFGTTNTVSAFTAKTVSLFNGKLMFGNTTEGTALNFINRVRLSQIDDFEDFRAAQGGEIVELVEGSTGIVAMEPMSEFVVVYKEDAIYRGDWIGSPNVSVRFTATVHNEGCLATNAVAALPGYHYFVGKRNIYQYDGGKQLQPIGDPIRDYLYTPSRHINVSNQHYVFAFFDPEERELTVVYPKGTTQGAREALRYHEAYKSWSTRTYNNWLTYGTAIRSHQTLTWADLRQGWRQYDQPWSTAFFVNAKIHKFLLGNGSYVNVTAIKTAIETTDLYVYDINEIKTSDDGFSIRWELETKDFYLPSSYIRVDFADVYCAGDDVALHFSDDLGNTFKRVRQTSARDLLEAERLFMNQAGKQMRFRFRGQSTNFQLGWIGFSFAPEFSW